VQATEKDVIHVAKPRSPAEQRKADRLQAKAARLDAVPKPDRVEPVKGEKPEAGRPEKMEKPEQSAKPDQVEKLERPAKLERVEKPERVEKVELLTRTRASGRESSTRRLV